MSPPLIHYFINLYAWVGFIGLTILSGMGFVDLFCRLYRRLQENFTPKGMLYSLRFYISNVLYGSRWKEYSAYCVAVLLAKLRRDDPALFQEAMNQLNDPTILDIDKL